MVEKIRLDKLLVERCFFDSRERAQAHIMAGLVFIDGRRVDKPGTRFRPEVAVQVTGKTHPFVSRGGLKLEKALQCFQIPVRHRIAMDVGASTGGFTDCLLQRGAAIVFAVDVGVGQLDWKLTSHGRVVNLEKTNFRYLELIAIGTYVDLMVVDVSFISLTKILEHCRRFIVDGGDLVALIKPQFEAGRASIQKGGVVNDTEVQAQTVAAVSDCAQTIGFTRRGLLAAPIQGKKAGNQEYLIHLIKNRTLLPKTIDGS
jgi:23S rRNA (cytidine1920-2'-O)/16S rRNA (cytidine1409-2'-O)-methyltransferase